MDSEAADRWLIGVVDSWAGIIRLGGSGIFDMAWGEVFESMRMLIDHPADEEVNNALATKVVSEYMVILDELNRLLVNELTWKQHE